MSVCCRCGIDSARTITLFRPDGDHIFCRVCKPMVTPKAVNPFANFTLQHIHGHDGKPITINSLRELRAAEKEHSFALAIASDNDDLAANPPQHQAWAGNIAADYTRKFNRDPAAYSQSEIDKCKSGVGTVQDKSHTLADHPNPLSR
jgi:hypothetical protein